MQITSVASDPFSILTVVVAPAVLTNASSVLALGTNNRLARVADRSHIVNAQLAKLEPGARELDVWAPNLARCKHVLNCCYERFAAFTWASDFSPARRSFPLPVLSWCFTAGHRHSR